MIIKGYGSIESSEYKEFLWKLKRKKDQIDNNNFESIPVVTHDNTDDIEMRRSGYNNLENESNIQNTGLFDTPLINFNERLQQVDENDRKIAERLRRHLQFFFLDPVRKFKIRRQIPFKLLLQILKVVIVTVQVCMFAQMRISHVEFLDETVVVMRHKFLKMWDDERDAVVYPPESGRYAVFSSEQILEHFAFMVSAYYNVENESFAAFSYDTYKSKNLNLVNEDKYEHVPPMNLCIDRIADVDIQNETYIFDISQVSECMDLKFKKADIDEMKKDPLYIRKWFEMRNITFDQEDALIITRIVVKFNLRTIHFSSASTDQKPECYLIKINVEFDNSKHSGQVFIKLDTLISYVNLCNGRVLQVGPITTDTIIISIIDTFVLLMCIASVLLCIRALIKAYLLQKETERYFARIFGIELKFKDKSEFLNIWYCMIVVNDILIIIGTITKVSIEFKDFDSQLFTLTGILLGLGILLVYLGLFRYFRFFPKYNVLILTLITAVPNLIRFLSCVLILYIGFLIGGWVIIGPYSIKFRTLVQSSEALFSLLNGDDMFATFYTISDSNTTINIIGKIYIYVFVALFIYVVLSLFIAIVMDAYEVIKDHWDRQLKVEESSLKEFLSSAEAPDFSSPEAREQFAADRLLNLGL